MNLKTAHRVRETGHESEHRVVPFIWYSRKAKSVVVESRSVVARSQRVGEGNACEGARGSVFGVLEYSVMTT